MKRIANLINNLNEFFNERASVHAIQTQFIRRQRKITGSSFIKAMIFGNMSDSNSSIEGFCGLLKEDSVKITKQGLDFRFTAFAVDFMERMFQDYTKEARLTRFING